MKKVFVFVMIFLVIFLFEFSVLASNVKFIYSPNNQKIYVSGGDEGYENNIVSIFEDYNINLEDYTSSSLELINQMTPVKPKNYDMNCFSYAFYSQNYLINDIYMSYEGNYITELIQSEVLIPGDLNIGEIIVFFGYASLKFNNSNLYSFSCWNNH